MPNFPGTPDDDFFFGTEDPETISGQGGDDFLNGGGGDDLVSGDGGDDNLFGGLGDDTIRGGGGNDFISGDGGADELRGGAGDDTIVANSSFDSSYNPDRLRGGAGSDRFDFVVVDPGSRIAGADFVFDFEDRASGGGDSLFMTVPFGEDARLVFGGNALFGSDEPYTAGDGLIEVYYAPVFDNDTAIFADSNDDGEFTPDDLYIVLDGVHPLRRADFGDTEFALVGGTGDDSIKGNAFGDPILGLGGNDTLEGGRGDDQIEGGDGDDSANGGKGNDRVDGGEGNDTLDGGAGRDFVAGGDGNDSVRGGTKDDNVSGGSGNDFVAGDEGDDNVDGDEGADTLLGGAGGDDLVAGDGRDRLEGEAGDDLLQGGDGQDTMRGGDGDDELIGYELIDISTGGAGDDSFVFFLGSFAPSSTLAAPDTVTDFQGAGQAGGDLVDLAGEQLAFAGRINSSPKAGAALPGAGDGVKQLVYIQRGPGVTYLIADENDNGTLDADDFMVRFIGTLHFTVDDFDNVDFVTTGTAGDDTIRGTSGDDKIFGLGGADSLAGLAGDDELHGGAGADTLDGGPGGFDSLFGDQGADMLTITSDGGSADGGAGNDTLIGSILQSSFSQLNGGKGDDQLRAGPAGATMIGDDGADQLISGSGDDGLSGGLDASFNPDGDEDLFIYGTDPWGADTVFDFEDGVDLFDMSASGLAFEDLTIDDSSAFQTVISSSLGSITITHFFDPVTITEADFIF